MTKFEPPAGHFAGGHASADEIRAAQARLDESLARIARPDQDDVDQLRELLDLMAGFSDNDQRARYLLSSNWLRDYRR